MSGVVSPFRNALGYQLSIHYKTSRQIDFALKKLGTNRSSARIEAYAHTSTKSFSPSSSRAQKQSRSQSRTLRTPSTHATRNTNNSAAQPSRSAPIQRNRNLQSGVSSKINTREKRNRKSIANTQADKHGNESSNMTSLETSGIDGKGLKINRIR